MLSLGVAVGLMATTDAQPCARTHFVLGGERVYDKLAVSFK
jgi:hypothetical protein